MDARIPNFDLSTMQVCDCCRRRKLKCDRLYPCGACKSSLLNCSYNHVLQRKGPKPDKRLSRSSVRLEGDDYDSPGSATSCTFQSSSFTEGIGGCSPSTTTASSPTSSVPALEEYVHVPASRTQLASPPPTSQRLSSLVILAHVSVYLKYLFPIMPVFDPGTVIQDSSDPERLLPERYAFLAALCAITHIQLKLNGSDLTEKGISISGDALLSEAVRARNEYNTIEHSSVDSLLTSFYLFASYGNLEKHCHASFYLCQAVCMGHTLGLNRESAYSEMDLGDVDYRRRIFWLLFVSERAYALQQSKPVMTRSSIRKPEVLGSDDPNSAYGLLNLINLYEKLPVELYDFMSSECDDGASGFALASFIHGSLSFPLNLEDAMETQRVDIIVTQQWLQGVMWKLGLSRSPYKLLGNQGSIPPDTPLSAAYSIMEVFASVSQSSIDVHGISMEQKLFDVGTYVADLARLAHSSCATSVQFPNIYPNDLLWGILNSLSNIRGSQSHLFPVLLEISGDILGLESPSISNISLTAQEDLIMSQDCWLPTMREKCRQNEPGTQLAALESYACELESGLLASTYKEV